MLIHHHTAITANPGRPGQFGNFACIRKPWLAFKLVWQRFCLSMTSSLS